MGSLLFSDPHTTAMGMRWTVMKTVTLCVSIPPWQKLLHSATIAPLREIPVTDKNVAEKIPSSCCMHIVFDKAGDQPEHQMVEYTSKKKRCSICTETCTHFKFKCECVLLTTI